MRLQKVAVAGSLESSDVLVTVEPSEEDLIIDIDSVVIHQFGPQIEASVRDVLGRFSVAHARVRVVDRGAVDCTLRARVETAIRRAGEVPFA